MKKLLLSFTLSAIILSYSCTQKTLSQKIALRLSDFYKERGMKDSAAYYKELSKVIR